MSNNNAVVKAQAKIEKFITDNFTFETREEYALFQAKMSVAAEATRRFVVLLEMGNTEQGAYDQAFAWMVSNI